MYLLRTHKLIKRKFKYSSFKGAFFSIERVYKVRVSGERKTKTTRFLMQRRTYKEGFPYWQKYMNKWLKFEVFRNKTIKFYFTPLRTRTWLLTKKQKYLKSYKRFYTLHPRVGKYTTIGLCGNLLGRNTLFLKHKILLKIFSSFYKIKNIKIFKYIGKKYNKIYSQFDNNLTNILDFFERRLDVTVFRSNFTVAIALARLIVFRGYICINFILKTNPHFRVQLGDFISTKKDFWKKSFLVWDEKYTSFKNIYLMKLSKMPYLQKLSGYINTILSSTTQMVGSSLWFQKLAATHTMLADYEN